LSELISATAAYMEEIFPPVKPSNKRLTNSKSKLEDKIPKPNKTYPIKVPTIEISRTFLRPNLSDRAPRMGAPINWVKGYAARSKPKIMDLVDKLAPAGKMELFESRKKAGSMGITIPQPRRSINAVSNIEKSGKFNRDFSLCIC